MGSLTGYLALLRWPGAVTAAANAGTGFLLVRNHVQHESLTPGIAVCGAAACVYLGGVVLNDVADAAADRTLHPERPIPSGRAQRGPAAALGLALIAIGCALAFALAGPHAGWATVGAAGAALLYDFGAKRWRLPGSLAMGLARGANAAAGCLASGVTLEIVLRDSSPAVLAYPVAIAGYTLLLTLVSTFEGRTPSARVATLLATILVLPAALAWPHFYAEWWWAPALPLFALTATLVTGAREAQIEDGPGIGAIVRRAVFGFLLVDAAWLMGVEWYDAGFWLILLYLALRFVLARMRS